MVLRESDKGEGTMWRTSPSLSRNEVLRGREPLGEPVCWMGYMSPVNIRYRAS